MRVFQRFISGDSNLLEQAQAVRIETASGMILSITENKDGSLNISESTHFHLSITPRAANAIILGTVMPEAFSVRPSGD
jgi:hypothetical protein